MLHSWIIQKSTIIAVIVLFLTAISFYFWSDLITTALGAILSAVLGITRDETFRSITLSLLRSWSRPESIQPISTMETNPMFETLKADIAAAKVAAVKDAEALISAAQTEAGKKVIAGAIAALPEVDQPIAQALQSLITDPSIENFATVLEDVYARFNAVKNAPTVAQEPQV